MVIVACFVILSMVIGGLMVQRNQRLHCIELVKDKPAAEIAMVCK